MLRRCARRAGGHGRELLDGVERRGVDLGHGRDVAAEVGVLASIDHLVEVVDLGTQGSRVLADELGELLDGVGLDDPALLDLDRVVGRPVVGVLDAHGPADPVVHQGLSQTALLVEDDVHGLRAADRHVDILAVAVVLHVLALVAASLVVVAGAVSGGLHPAAVDHVELADEAGLVVGHLDAVEHAAAHGVVVHVPHLGADGELHLHAVAADPGRTAVVDGVGTVEVAVHLGIALVAAGAQQNALVGLDVHDAAVGLGDLDAVDALAQGILNQSGDAVLVVGLGAADLGGSGHAVPAAAVLEGLAAVLLAEVTGGTHEVGTLKVGELHEQGAVAQRAATGVTHLVAGGLKGALGSR